MKFISFFAGIPRVTQGQKQRVACEFCGKEHWRKPHSIKRAKHHYCSQECMGKAYRMNYLNQRKVQGECKYCRRPIYHKLRETGRGKSCKSLFCDMSCYRKWRDQGIGERVFCKHCGRLFYKVPSSPAMCCSYECGLAYRNSRYLLGVGKNKSRKVHCHGCGKEFVAQESKAKIHEALWCSRECYMKLNKLERTAGWKGGWYINGIGRVMIAIGHKHEKGKSGVRYRDRHIVACELYLGYMLRFVTKTIRGPYILPLNNDVRDVRPGNLFVCDNQSEYLRRKNGSLPWPDCSNLDSIQQSQLYKATSFHMKRIPLQIVQELFDDSLSSTTGRY